MITVYRVFGEVRRLFHTLSRVAESIHSDIGITAGQRALLESLSESPGRTVPEIARSRGVTRQHIQTLANQLLDKNLVETRDNPAHKRSPVLRLTAAGERCFDEIRRREGAILKTMDREFRDCDLGAVVECLGRMNRYFEEA